MARKTKYPFTTMAVGETAFIPYGDDKAKTAGRVHAHTSGKRFIMCEDMQDGVPGLTVHRGMDTRPFIDLDRVELEEMRQGMKGPMKNDLVRAEHLTTESQTVRKVKIRGRSVRRVGILLSQMEGVRKLKAWDGEKYITIWAVRNAEKYADFRPSELYRNFWEMLQ